MVWVGVAVATVLLLLATIQADVLLHDLRLRLKGLYSLERLQFQTGLRTQQEIELAVDSLPRADQLYALSRECVAKLPRRWLTTGPQWLPLTVAAWAGLCVFLGSAWLGAPRYDFLIASGSYVSLCLGWDIWVVSWFDFQLDPHVEAVHTRAHEALSDDIGTECEREEFDLLTQTQLLDRGIVLEQKELKRVLVVALADPANAPTIKVLYWVICSLAGAWFGRQRRKVSGLTQEVCELAKRPGPLAEDRLLRRIRYEIDDASERMLLGKEDDGEPRLERLRRIEADLAAVAGPAGADFV